MADHTGTPDHTSVPGQPPTPDYPLDEQLSLSRPDQYRALFEQTRQAIVGLLLERAATTSDLAIALEKPKGTVGHHLKVLEDAGLVRVVRTKRVRALEAKYYGRTARVFIFQKAGEAATVPQQILSTAATEIAEVPADTDLPLNANARYARIPAERAEEWSQRINELIMEFAGEPRGGDVTYGFVAGIYPTSRKRLPEPDHVSGAAPEQLP
ncbi:winged helix-turn-helix domain-containing protein [Phytoactinopolyspora mesophila]|uniref:Helix-turn-helix domain-containing protein n=1 Tax=Phytoactinopolyspora mesophila TaxID=2650750 RepID=A0A7K3MEF9_9ACTN|nr:winged helix-turn-helix domain-containing protein [Phytoactinopolyspora mesophila]NDL60798.1 helix-turn-helix domain-containing protein [Phytoactinopolyspora mesophila]